MAFACIVVVLVVVVALADREVLVALEWCRGVGRPVGAPGGALLARGSVCSSVCVCVCVVVFVAAGAGGSSTGAGGGPSNGYWRLPAGGYIRLLSMCGGGGLYGRVFVAVGTCAGCGLLWLSVAC